MMVVWTIFALLFLAILVSDVLCHLGKQMWQRYIIAKELSDDSAWILIVDTKKHLVISRWKKVSELSDDEIDQQYQEKHND